MHSPDYEAFEANIDRARALIRIFERGRSRGRPKAEDTQLTRSSLVFSIGALDAYLHDLVLTVVSEFVPPSDALDDTIKAMRPHKLVQTMAKAKSAPKARAKLRESLDEHFDDKSFMDVGGLQRALNLIGCEHIKPADLAQITGRSDLAAKLGQYTDTRHRIVHRGENARVTKEMAQDCADLVTAIVSAVDNEVVSRYH